MKKLPALLLILIIPALIFIFKSNTFNQTASANLKPDLIMEMGEYGYTPKNATIKVGQVIEFKNISSSDRWPASNIHPTHLIYPEFDPKKGVPPGKSWSFKFDKVGIWRYHDHLNPTIIGTITVNE